MMTSYVNIELFIDKSNFENIIIDLVKSQKVK